MKMISPSNVAVDIGQTLKPHEYIGMVRREVLDSYLRDRAATSGATVINGLFLKMEMPSSKTAPYLLHYTDYNAKTGGSGEKKTLEVDAVIGADGANSRVAKSINAGEYEYAIAFQERIRIPDEKMKHYENLAEMYVGDAQNRHQEIPACNKTESKRQNFGWENHKGGGSPHPGAPAAEEADGKSSIGGGCSWIRDEMFGRRDIFCGEERKNVWGSNS